MSPFLATVGIGLGYYMSAMLSLKYTQGAEGIAVMWPASGLLLAALIIAPKRHRGGYLAAATVASLVANLGNGVSLALSIGFTFANITEALMALWLIARFNISQPRFDDIGDVGRFAIAAGTASLWSAGLATLFSQLGMSFFLSWLTTVFIGIMFVTPIIVTIALLLRMRWFSLTERRSSFEVGAWLSAVTIVTLAVFLQDTYPLLFLPPVVVLAATYRLNSFGAAASVLIVAIIATILTDQGYGPVHFMPGGEEAVILFMQFYLLVQLGCALPLAATLAARVRLTRKLTETNRLLNLAEAAAQVGHCRLNFTKQSLFWSDEVFRIHGLEPGHTPTMTEALEAFVPEDRERVKGLLRHAAETGTPFEFHATIVRPDGTERHVHSCGEVEFGPDGSPIALFGSIQDITTHVTLAQKLETARIEAEATARQALQLANTDVLTGLPNRRHTLQSLDLAVAKSNASGQPFAIAMFDIDRFKSINDRYGHASGDEVLRRVAKSAARAGRNGDLVGRIGGEEFVMLLPGANAAAAMRAAERIRAAIELESLASENEVSVTVSVGVASLQDGLTGEMLLNLADMALYNAKAAGRNVIRLFA